MEALTNVYLMMDVKTVLSKKFLLCQCKATSPGLLGSHWTLHLHLQWGRDRDVQHKERWCSVTAVK